MTVKTASDGTRFEVFEGPGPAVVLVHGLGLNRHMWQWQSNALAERYTVISYDLFGHGESPPPPDTPCLTLFSEQLRRLVVELGIAKVAVAGFSLGGMIARRFAMDHEPRLWALAILHSAHQRDQAAHDAIQSRVHQARRDGPAATVDAALERWFSTPFHRDNPDIMQQVRTWVMANSKEIYPDIYQVLVDGVDELIAPPRAIRCPALVMTGSEDYGNSTGMTRAIAAEIPCAKTVILPGLRHMAMAENPTLFNSELQQFLHHAEQEGSDAG
ncbi:alpha/beta fold hydrolase [Anderseniella sp. Alg231-50]|uniref:alpha/beta fold hydrolase n=1 Tax=Anderseniella sp. Alg231-50 TaxID=1922226 RepID=UPI00307B295A